MTDQEHEAEADDNTIFLTNSISWIHAVQWGATIKVETLRTDGDVKDRLRGKKIEAFIWPDSDLMGKLTMYGVIPAPDPTLVKTAFEANEFMETAFFNFVNNTWVKHLGRSIKELGKPTPLKVGKPMVLCQFVLAQGGGLIEQATLPTLKLFWFEVTPLEVKAKPQEGVLTA